MRFKIYHKGETEAFIEVEKLTYSDEWMGEEFVTVSVSSETPVDWRIGDYIIYRGQEYTLSVIPATSKQARRNSVLGAFSYEGVKFRSCSDELTRCKFLDVVPRQNTAYYTGLTDFNFYCPDVNQLAERIQANLDRLYTENRWTVTVANAGSVKNKVVSVSNIYCWEALALVESEFDLNFVIRGRNIIIGDTGELLSRYFEYGKDKGLFKIERSTDDSQQVVTRLRAYGNTTNMPVRYYANVGLMCYIDLAEFTKTGTGQEADYMTLAVPADKASRMKFKNSISVESVNYTKYVFKVRLGKATGTVWFADNGNNESYINFTADSDAGTPSEMAALTAEYNKGERICYVLSNYDKDKWYTGWKVGDPDNRFPDNMNCRHLMLPGFPYKSLKEWADGKTLPEWDGKYSQDIYDPFIDSKNADALGIREATIFFDGSEDRDDIYPSIEWMKDGEGNALNVVKVGSTIEDDGVFDGNVSIPNFKITIADIGFNPMDYADGTPTISMKDGMCGGREFEIVGAKKVSLGYELTLKRLPDSSLDLYFPYRNFQIREGDKFVLLNIEMPSVYVDAASEELLRQAKEWLAKNDYVVYKYSLSIDELFMQRQHDAHIANNEDSLHDTIKAGSVLHFEDADLDIVGAITIDKLEIKEGEYLLPQYSVTLSEDKTVGTLQRMQQQIDSIASGRGGGGYTASEIDTMIRNVGAKHFLSKQNDDTAKGKITFEKGIDFGQFVSGIVGGSGGRIDKDGNAELESLVLRSFLEVPELRFNRIDVVSGELWNSIAFGTIASVTVSNDGKGGTAWVHLEKTERCGLKVGDICRGIFSDFGDGKPKDENEDDNGFQKTYGFSTAYFTPTAIIRNEEGEFGFQYAIQAGTKVHPCAYMKFAVYGSFTDPSRRASAYFTRSYMRYLKNVQTWRITPDDNIASQFGNLDGLTIGGMQMKGEGTFLSNIYMTGAVIQFSPEQKKELMGQDAYSVVLSDYEAVLHVSVDGFVRDINKIREVVASNGNVMAMKDGVAVNVTDLGYNAATAVQVYKGKSMMHHAPMVGELAYTIVPVFYNCEGFIANGVLVVNKIVNPEENAYVDMEVNCEGFAVFTKHYAITVIKDASSPVVADLDNEMDTVVENPLTGDIIGSPLVTNAHMHYGTDEMTIVSMSANLPLPNGIACEVDGSKATISVGKDAGAASAISFRVVGKTAVSETLHTREVRFIANKVKSQYQLKLVPSVAEVKVDADGTFNGSQSASVKCQVLVNDGTSSLIPDTYEALKGYRARMFYGVNVKSDVPDFTNEVTDSIYADGVAVTSSDDSVTFWLYYYPNGINVASGRVRFDMETIHVLHDASDSFTQFVFKRVNADSVAAPKGGSYSSPLPDGWSDGVPAGSAKLWMSSRRFTSNGKNQDDAWSTPRPMTDTADFDVCFHDAVSGDAAPSAPPKDMHPTQTGMSGNNGWYDDGKTTSEWMAMATCSNGVWSDWSIVKIVGESPVIADIDNEMDGIGVGSDGILDVATSTSTNVCMYHGSRLMQIRSVSVSGLPSGVTASTAYPSSSDHSRCTVTFTIPSGTDFSAKNRYAITITVVATYNDVDYTRTLTYTLLGTTNGKDGEVYYLQPSTTAVKRNKDLVYSPSEVTCARYIKKGTSDALASSEGELTMSTDGGSTWDDYRTVSNFSGVSSIIYRWMLNGVEVDRETVPVISDGIDGKSNVIADIDNEMDSIITDVDGNFSGSVALYANVSMWYGTTKLTLDEITFSSVTGVTSSGNKSTGKCTFSVTSSMSDKAVISITVKATHNGTQYVRTLTFTISKVKQGSKGENAIVYAIKTSVSSVKVDKSGNVSPSSVSASVTKTEGGSTQTLSSLVSGMSLQSSKTGSSWSNNPSVDVSKSDTQVYFRLMLNGVEIDHETVPVIADGEDGRGIEATTDLFCALSSDKEADAKNSANVWKSFDNAKADWNSSKPYLWKRTEITYTDGKSEYKYSINSVYQKGDNGAPLIPLRWDDLAIGDMVYSGNNGEITTNIVLYRGLWYRCMVTHAIKSGETPDSDNVRWTLMNNFKNVATELFFATLAYIQNLLLNNAKAGYQVGDRFIPTIEFSEKGDITLYGRNSDGEITVEVTISSDGLVIRKKGATGSIDRLTVDWNGLMYGGSDANSGTFQNGSMYLHMVSGGKEQSLTITPFDISNDSYSASIEDLFKAVNGTKIVVCEGSLPSTTVANTLYVVI